jgi:phage recombination protein Bet
MTQNLPAQKTWEVKYLSDGVEVLLNEQLIKTYLVRGKSELVTKQEMAFFMGICKARALNPFAGDCYLIKYTQNDPAAIITSIDFKRSRAKANHDCRGWTKGIIVQKPDGTIRDSAGIILEGEKLIGGWFEATPDKWSGPFRLEVNLSGYVKKTSEGKTTRFWQEENQPTMIAKVAESQGLSALWPRELGKLYTTEEIGNEPQDLSSIIDMDEDKTNQNDPEPTVETFIALAREKIQGNQEYSISLNLYLAKSADLQKKTTDQIMLEAAKDGETFKKFWTMFTKWHEQEKKKNSAKSANGHQDTDKKPCPNDPENELSFKYCRENCKSFTGCPAWE